MRLSKTKRNVKSVFNTYIDVISFKNTQKDRYAVKEQMEPDHFDEATKIQLYDLASRKDIYNLLT